MKEWIKNIGIFLLLAGIILLILSLRHGSINNTGLAVSSVFFLAGLILHVLLNRYLD